MKSKQRKVLTGILNYYTVIGLIIVLIGTGFLLAPLYPYIFFQLNNEALANEQSNVENLATELVGKEVPKEAEKEDPMPLPPINKDLTDTNTLLIPKINVVGKVNENINSNTGLSKGMWRVPEWGDPINNDNPIIIASHRFGYLTWSRDFRIKNSFESLPKTKVGDRIEIIWQQRRFVYEIYKVEESTKLTDYSADLILYTCKTLNSDIRVVRYAMRVE